MASQGTLTAWQGHGARSQRWQDSQTLTTCDDQAWKPEWSAQAWTPKNSISSTCSTWRGRSHAQRMEKKRAQKSRASSRHEELCQRQAKEHTQPQGRVGTQNNQLSAKVTEAITRHLFLNAENSMGPKTSFHVFVLLSPLVLLGGAVSMIGLWDALGTNLCGKMRAKTRKNNNNLFGIGVFFGVKITFL